MKLSNEEWAKEVRIRVEDLNDLLKEAPERDLYVEIEQKINPVTEIHPVLTVVRIAHEL